MKEGNNRFKEGGNAGHVQYTNWQLCIQTTKPHSIVAIEWNPSQISELDNLLNQL